MVIFLGCLSLSCLALSLVLPHWVTTYESVPPPQHTRTDQILHWSLNIHIGLFSVCPQVSNLTVQTVHTLQPAYRARPAHLSLKCSAISYTNMSTLLGHRDLHLWAPVKRTMGLVNRIRFDSQPWQFTLDSFYHYQILLYSCCPQHHLPDHVHHPVHGGAGHLCSLADSGFLCQCSSRASAWDVSGHACGCCR